MITAAMIAAAAKELDGKVRPLTDQQAQTVAVLLSVHRKR
jgi:hypothetical protein